MSVALPSGNDSVIPAGSGGHSHQTPRYHTPHTQRRRSALSLSLSHTHTTVYILIPAAHTVHMYTAHELCMLCVSPLVGSSVQYSTHFWHQIIQEYMYM